MGVMTVSLILTYVHFVLVQGLDSDVSHTNFTGDIGGRILYGETADPESFSYTVRLYCTEAPGGGSIINDHFILTAAHCIQDCECTKLPISTSSWAPGDQPTIHAVECYPHEQYTNKVLFYYDIALIKTQEDLVKDLQLKLIPLPAPGTRYPVDAPGVTAGWGYTEENVLPNHLLRADVVVEDWGLCNNIFKSTYPCDPNVNCPVPDLPKESMCTRGLGRWPPGPCLSDSGGPLVINGALAGMVTAVLVDTTTRRCEPGTPSLYLSVVDFLPWISSHTQ